MIEWLFLVGFGFYIMEVEERRVLVVGGAALGISGIGGCSLEGGSIY